MKASQKNQTKSDSKLPTDLVKGVQENRSSTGPLTKHPVTEPRAGKGGIHHSPLEIHPNNFLFKSLSCWNLNPTMGCSHGCLVCFVPDTSTNKQQELLATYDVEDPVSEWGDYVLVRPLDERAFMASLQKAENTPGDKLNPDGNRAVMLSSTTDPYQSIRNGNPEKQKLLNEMLRRNVRKALELIRDHSTLNVRILTRSALAKEDFELFKSFGNRLMLGISLPTMDGKLSKLYEPHSPHPKQRLKMLVEASKQGIPTYVAIAPVYPGTDYEGLKKVFEAIKAANPLTVFMEPVNCRLGIHERLTADAERTGVNADFSLFTPEGYADWADYALNSLNEAERAAEETGLRDRLHLWPDHTALGAKKVRAAQEDPDAYDRWLNKWWNRISEWPGRTDNG